jgi:predicted peptidase
MNFALLDVVSGALLMAQFSVPMAIEPGKQLPHSVTIRDQSHREADVTVRYMLFAPRDYQTNGQPWPLLLFLHGLGECSHDDLDRVKIHGPPKLVDSRPDFPFVLVTPQCPPPDGGLKGIRAAWNPEHLIQLLDHVSANLNVDTTRVYVTGLSMGGYGTWRIAATYPDRFAAAVPICGGGEPESMAPALRRVPIWAFHGARDAVVPLSKSQEMVDEVRRLGGDVRFTVYPDAQHDSWTATYDNQDVFDWLLSQRIKSQ